MGWRGGIEWIEIGSRIYEDGKVGWGRRLERWFGGWELGSGVDG